MARWIPKGGGLRHACRQHTRIGTSALWSVPEAGGQGETLGEGAVQLQLRSEDTQKLEFCEQFDLRMPGAAYAGAEPFIAAFGGFDRAFQHLLAARPQLCAVSKVQRVL